MVPGLLRFADDISLIPSSLFSLAGMLEGLRLAAQKFGLQLHLTKTKRLSNVRRRRGIESQSHIRCGTMDMNILKHEASTEYLGRLVIFRNSQGG